MEGCLRAQRLIPPPTDFFKIQELCFHAIFSATAPTTHSWKEGRGVEGSEWHEFAPYQTKNWHKKWWYILLGWWDSNTDPLFPVFRHFPRKMLQALAKKVTMWLKHPSVALRAEMGRCVSERECLKELARWHLGQAKNVAHVERTIKAFFTNHS